MQETREVEESGPVGSRQRFLSRPSTKPGRWSVGLASAFIALFVVNAAVFMRLTSEAAWLRTAMIFYGFAMLFCGLAAGIAGLFAVARRRERSWLVWLSMAPGAFVVFLLLGELLAPH